MPNGWTLQGNDSSNSSTESISRRVRHRILSPVRGCFPHFATRYQVVSTRYNKARPLDNTDFVALRRPVRASLICFACCEHSMAACASFLKRQVSSDRKVCVTVPVLARLSQRSRVALRFSAFVEPGSREEIGRKLNRQVTKPRKTQLRECSRTPRHEFALKDICESIQYSLLSNQQQSNHGCHVQESNHHGKNRKVSSGQVNSSLSN